MVTTKLLLLLMLFGWWLLGLFIVEVMNAVFDSNMDGWDLLMALFWPVLIVIFALFGIISGVIWAATTLGDFIRSKL